jgi:hypothetical protein
LTSIISLELSSLGEQFTEDEVLQVIRSLLPDKALGKDRLTIWFLRSAWDIIRVNLMEAFHAFWHLDTRNFHTINEALMVLLQKSAEAVAIKDFHRISLIDVLSKLFSKLLANHLAPRPRELIHVSQSAFVKGQFILDNFKVVQGTAKLLHAKK